MKFHIWGAENPRRVPGDDQHDDDQHGDDQHEDDQHEDNTRAGCPSADDVSVSDEGRKEDQI